MIRRKEFRKADERVGKDTELLCEWKANAVYAMSSGGHRNRRRRNVVHYHETNVVELDVFGDSSPLVIWECMCGPGRHGHYAVQTPTRRYSRLISSKRANNNMRPRRCCCSSDCRTVLEEDLLS